MINVLHDAEKKPSEASAAGQTAKRVEAVAARLGV